MIAVRRLGVGTAPGVQFKIGEGSWTLGAPLNSAANPAVYEMVVAYGAPDEFPTPHPSGTIVVTESVPVWMRAVSGRQIRAEQVARIEVS